MYVGSVPCERRNGGHGSWRPWCSPEHFLHRKGVCASKGLGPFPIRIITFAMCLPPLLHLPQRQAPCDRSTTDPWQRTWHQPSGSFLPVMYEFLTVSRSSEILITYKNTTFRQWAEIWWEGTDWTHTSLSSLLVPRLWFCFCRSPGAGDSNGWTH